MRAPLAIEQAARAPTRALDAERALRPGRPRRLVGCASRPSVCTEQATHRMSWAAKAAVGLGLVPILARCPRNSKISFSIFHSFSNLI
jgi:hypothetical protein